MELEINAVVVATAAATAGTTVEATTGTCRASLSTDAAQERSVDLQRLPLPFYLWALTMCIPNDAMPHIDP